MASSPKSHGCFEDDYREMTDEEINLYYEAVWESEGFDVPNFHDSYAIGLIVPMFAPFPSEVKKFAEEAIKHYNSQNGTNFEFVSIVMANIQGVCGLLYFITFEVKPIGTPPVFPTTTFQARVLLGIPDTVEVELCRPKPKPKPL